MRDRLLDIQTARNVLRKIATATRALGAALPAVWQRARLAAPWLAAIALLGALGAFAALAPPPIAKGWDAPRWTAPPGAGDLFGPGN